MKTSVTKSTKMRISIIIIVILLFTFISIFSASKINQSLQKNISSRALNEIKTTASEQVRLIYNELNTYFDPLKFAAEYLESGHTFGSAESASIIEAIISANDWNLIGYAGKDGISIDFNGSFLGNVAENIFFKKIMDESSACAIDYIANDGLNSAHIVFSVPCRNGESEGILFASMDFDILENIILGNTAENDLEEVFLINTNGYILGANQKGAAHIPKGGDIFDLFADDSPSSDNKANFIESMHAHQNGVFSCSHLGTAEKCVFEWTGINDWYVIVSADIAKAEEKYAANVLTIKNTMINIFVTFALLLVVITIIYGVFLKYLSRTEKSLTFEKIKNDLLLQEAGDEQFVYDVKTKKMTGKGALVKMHDNTIPNDLSLVVNTIIDAYPEVKDDLEKIVQTLYSVAESGKIEVFDRPMSLYGNTRWIKMVFVPYSGNSKTITHVFASMHDATYMHREFEKSLDILNNLPGGFHRCHLSDPIHLEYISDGLCKLLGYTIEEITALIGNTYSLLLLEEDRPAFRDFVHRLAACESNETCEYRMKCKSGKIITVSDTMESIRDANGIMYGYSAVTDITEKAEEIRNAKEQINEGEKLKNKLINEQLLLVAAAKTAYSMILSVNLTQNTYYVLEQEKISAEKENPEGNYDQMFEMVAKAVPNKAQSKMFREAFDRNHLIEAYKNEEKSISVRHTATTEDGVVHWIDTQMIFVDPDNDENVRAIFLMSCADENQKLLNELQNSLSKESIYREAIMTTSIGYMEIDFSSGYFESDILALSKGSEPQVINIPELTNPVKYNTFVTWWANNMLVSDKETFLRMSNTHYIMTMFTRGNRYIEVPFRTKLMSDKEYDCIQMYFLSKDKVTGHIKGICILNDVTEQESSKKEITHLMDELHDSRIKNSISQMQPHFLYNALASIREIILDDPQYASDLIYDFTTHLRACIKSMSSSDLIPLSKELDNIKAYVNIEKMRFGNKLRIEYDIDCEDFMIIPLSIQPLVENSIRHGIYERGAKGGKVCISAKKKDDNYLITIDDDGVGFDFEALKNDVSSGRRDCTGLCNAVFRFEKSMHATVSINSVIGTGTKITVTIPCDKKENQ